jgi:hypothetical protein
MDLLKWEDTEEWKRKWEKKVMRILRQHQIMIDQKQPENVGYFNYLGSVITNDSRYTRDIKSRIVMAKQHSTRRLFSPAN